MPRALAVAETLLVLKVVFLVLLYLFIWLVARTATKDVATAPQESILLSRDEADVLRAAVPAPTALFRVEGGPGLSRGGTVEVSGSTVVGRGSDSDVQLDGDDFASSRHARLESRADGTWVVDLESTNGTFVNGKAVTQPTRLRPGDVVRVGRTEFRLEA
jgi:pSer/pThr/pTyr-binding forkhead associated (FHA) protein